MDIESTKVTPEEIAQFRAELAEDSKALGDIDVIERCEGDLEQAARILARRADIEDVRAGITWESALKQARQVVCDAKFKEGLAPDLIGGIIGALITAGNPVLVAVATPCAGYIVKVSLAEFCNTDKSNPES
ncbi:MAG: hypothetical protein IM333_01380 [Microcystis sp. M048S1]|jgi:hypothetical protein|uniref:hypothetical protein n=1 Tax=unclassified Microcystis TaxID=2643300 RepID=UPI001193B559|nr:MULTISPECIES: hypothetical protein [unclassified Microcystis]MCA2899601.1 hypothetical protein [Microcystis sp. M035S1]MCU7244793.1 hypothetical protein [Microcystis aeruginosa WS75]NCR23364.1 hypothetical protein [Microcystis aeruginosa L111-01]NCS03173.1 hypothetical protein [Microcystis aeruginosa G13-11]NCS15251.1 hypothetical protein [Microcystis aeruginosa G13-12]NCS44952.1 hypothetical protein [Microcystis aeruginosa BS11-05]NCS53723.1 hypothetical protein [Microcystis aeruginosa G